jgi:indole-3-glycerol phosphate synthase
VKELARSLPKGSFPFEAALRKKEFAFICEVKRASPSKGLIAADFPYQDLAMEYEGPVPTPSPC